MDEYLSELSDKALKELAKEMKIEFDWEHWLSPRYKLILTIEQERWNREEKAKFGSVR